MGRQGVLYHAVIGLLAVALHAFTLRRLALASLSSSIVNHEYILRFHTYQSHETLRQELQTVLGPESSSTWHWLDRSDAAASIPTDFALVHIAGPSTEHLHPDYLVRLQDHVVKQMNGRRFAASMTQALDPSSSSSSSMQPAAWFRDAHPHRRLRTKLQWWTEEDAETGALRKRPGRLQTRPTFGLDRDDDDEQDPSSSSSTTQHPSHRDTLSAPYSFSSRQLASTTNGVAGQLDADTLWREGIRGAGIRVGVFDTGFRADHPHFARRIKERTNWTHEPTLDDKLGHGSFVAGVIASSDASCPGMAPEVDLYEFRVFTNDQVSYTAWFLDAFNYAIASHMDLVNLSIGGPDYLDTPFVDKVQEVTSHGIIMVSAIGNDGPYYGTLNNPADMLDVLGVGGIDNGGKMAGFSSRGMSLWELPTGMGRVKPDVVAYGVGVTGSRIDRGCRSLSGTSVAAPVVAGATALVASVVPVVDRPRLLNPGSMKQIMMEGADRLPNAHIHEQGAGRINPKKSADLLRNYQPRASFMPAVLDMTDCPYMWPYCTQPMFAGGGVRVFNGTVLNGMAAHGYITDVKFEPALPGQPGYEGAKHLDVQFDYPSVLWPWSGTLSVLLRVKDSGAKFDGAAHGTIVFTVTSPPNNVAREALLAARGTLPTAALATQTSTVRVPLVTKIIPTPPRSKRLLWDQYHSHKYPSAYIPKDSLDARSDTLDWHGDSLYTNFHELFDHLVSNGLYIDVLSGPLTCFDAKQYQAILIVDAEEEYMKAEVDKLANDVRELGLGVIVVADWHNAEHAKSLVFYDDNTRSWWVPVTGGANGPALNDLLAPFQIGLGSAVIKGSTSFDNHVARVEVNGGATIASFPAGGFLFEATMDIKRGTPSLSGTQSVPILGHAAVGAGRVAVFTDSDCLDNDFTTAKCFELLDHLLVESGVTVQGVTKEAASWLHDETKRLKAAVDATREHGAMERFAGRPFDAFSHVLREEKEFGGPVCRATTSQGKVWGGHGGGMTASIDTASPPPPAKVQTAKVPITPTTTLKNTPPLSSSSSTSTSTSTSSMLYQHAASVALAQRNLLLGFLFVSLIFAMLWMHRESRVRIRAWTRSRPFGGSAAALRMDNGGGVVGEGGVSGGTRLLSVLRRGGPTAATTAPSTLLSP